MIVLVIGARQIAQVMVEGKRFRLCVVQNVEDEKMRRRTFLLGGAALALTGAGGWTTYAFRRDLAAARARVAGRSMLVASPFGQIEYALAGQGAPLLVSHGTGGGFDQCLLTAGDLRDDFQIIAPSRFGYLQSDFPADASLEMQADAFAFLLDHLGIAKAAVLGASAGAQPALMFALRHPSRCAGVIALVPAAFAPGRPPVEPPGPIARAIIDHALTSDFIFWSAMRMAPDAMIGALLATDPQLVAMADAAEKARVAELLESILPVSARARGLRFDGEIAYRPRDLPLGEISAPALALSFEDDRFDTAAAARHIAASVPHSALHIWSQGGHVGVGHQAEIMTAIAEFLGGLSR